MSRPYIRWCFVPMCKNNDKSNPGKIFVSVPSNHKIREDWWHAARREFPIAKSRAYCCEDHFNLQEDMDNYMYYTMMGGPVRLKPGVRPHKFDCQGKVTPHNENWEKLKRKMNTSKILSSVENINEADQNPPNQPDPEEARNECEDLNDPESLKPSTKNVGIQLQVHHSQKLSQPPLHPRVAVQDLSPARRKQCRDAAPYGQHLCPYIPPASDEKTKQLFLDISRAYPKSAVLAGQPEYAQNTPLFSNEKVFKVIVLPELLGKQDTCNSSSISTSNDSVYCYCEKEEEGKMVKCGNTNCKIKKFHMKCLGFARLPSKDWCCIHCKKIVCKKYLYLS